MIQILSTLRKSGRAIVVALVLGAATVTAMPAPAMAQSGPSFSFQLGIGGGGGGSLRFEGGDVDLDFCLSNSQIRRGLRDYGFRNIDIVRANRNRVVVIARYGRAWYRLQVSRCTGQVRIIERLRRGFPGGGFGLQFNFGM
ncbi:MAG: hypothetical protein ACYCZU_04590 [Devosia sp.]